MAFQSWLSPLLVGDFGNSLVTGRAVWPDMRSAVSYTIPLAVLGLVFGVALSVPLAMLPPKGQVAGWIAVLWRLHPLARPFQPIG